MTISINRRSRFRHRLAAAGFLAFFGLIAGSAVLRGSVSEQIDERTGCPVGGHSKVTVIGIDASDPLAPQNRSMLRQSVQEAAADRRDSRVILVRLSGSRSYRPDIVFDRCNPGAAREARRWSEGPAARQVIFDSRFLEPLNRAIERLALPTPEMRESYLADTIARMVSDPALHLREGERRLILLSDLIENTDLSRPYTTGVVRLPPVRERFLAGISVQLVELPAMTDATQLQTFTVRSMWRRWCQIAGALSCQVTAPGLAAAAPASTDVKLAPAASP